MVMQYHGKDAPRLPSALELAKSIQERFINYTLPVLVENEIYRRKSWKAEWQESCHWYWLY